jgi:hypothetical protein
MSGKNRAVFGIYANRLTAERAVDALKAEGFRSTDISVLLPESEGTRDLALQKATKAPEAAAAAGAGGVIVGGALGWLAGIGALAIPGLGPLIVAGPIVSALAGAGAGGAVAGLAGSLIGMGIPEYEAKRYEGRVKDGGILLSVHSDNSKWARRAKEILESTGANDISSMDEAGADTYDVDYRRHFDSRYAGLGYQYELYVPAYQFGAVCANDRRFRKSDWQTVEPELRLDWEARGDRGPWEDFKDSVRYGWERARGRKVA